MDGAVAAGLIVAAEAGEIGGGPLAGLLGAEAVEDGAIDRLVYELYGLTAEEIKIVEGGAAR